MENQTEFPEVEIFVKIEVFEKTQWVAFITLQHKETLKIGKGHTTAKSLEMLNSQINKKIILLYNKFLKGELKNGHV